MRTVGVCLDFDGGEELLGSLFDSSSSLLDVLDILQQDAFQVLHFTSFRCFLNLV